MANKYSEELFGAVDAIVKKRLEEFNRDTTILCKVEDITNAENGKYVVSNNALRFDAYTEKTDFKKGQNVWVLVPDGDYNNTKIIIGKHVSGDTDSFTWVDPFKYFVDMTGNLAVNFNTEYYNTNFKLNANGKRAELTYGDIVSDETYINGKIGTDIINGLKGLDRIAVSADFATQFSKDAMPISGDYGLRIDLITDKESDNEKTFYLSTQNGIIGALYTSTGSFMNHGVVYDFDPEEIGNVVRIKCTFFQSQNFINKNGKYNLDKNGDLINPLEDIAVSNLVIKMGYSTNKIQGTSALLSTFGSTFFTPNVDSDSRRYLVPRFAYSNGDGTFTFINNYNDYINAENENQALKKLKLHLYYQDVNQASIEPRISQKYYRESWERVNELDDASLTWETWENSNEFINKFEIPVDFDNNSAEEEKFKIAFSYKKSSFQMDAIENIFTEIIDKLNEKFFISEKFNYYDNDLDVIQVIMLYANKWFETKKDIFTNFYFYNEDLILPEGYNDYYIDNDGTMTEKELFLWNCIIALICESYATNAENKDYVSFEEDEKNIEFFGNQEEHGETYHAFAKYLIYKIISTQFSYIKYDIYRNFEKARYVLENIYVSNILTFSSTTSGETNIIDSIQGLELTATDAQNGIYNLYKASTNANSELIKPSDANVKRNIEVTFSSFAVGEDDLGSSKRIYWSIPKSSTMIKDLMVGLNFGRDIYNPLRYNLRDLQKWGEDHNKGGVMPLYYKNSQSTYVEIQYRDGQFAKQGDSNFRDVNEFLGDLGYDSVNNPYVIFYSKVNLFLIINKNTNAGSIDTSELPEGAILSGENRNVLNGIQGITDYLLEKYPENINASNEFVSKETKFLVDKFAKNDCWLIMEDRHETDSIKTNLQKASIAYQIKSVFRKNFTNNKINATIFRNTEKYTKDIELYFGVKGTNDSNYTLSITPVKEITKNNTEIMSPNAWTKGVTKQIELKAAIYDNDDKDISEKFKIEWKLYAKDEQSIASGDPEIKLPVDGAEQQTAFVEINGNDDTNFTGCIVVCTAQMSAISITQYYVLPVRAESKYFYINGPDTVVYDANKINPSYHNIAYALLDENYNEIAIEEGYQLNCEIKINDPSTTHLNLIPKIVDRYLVPTLNFMENEGYDFYVEISIVEQSNNENKQIVWWQPILVTLNNYTNSLIAEVADRQVRNSENKRTASSVMTVLKNEDGLTGIIIGSLPVKEVGSEHVAIERNGILGYLEDEEQYGFFADGTSFIKGKGITISTENSEISGDIIDKVSGNIIDYKEENKNLIFASPVNEKGIPKFRQLNFLDLPKIGNITNEGKIEIDGENASNRAIVTDQDGIITAISLAVESPTAAETTSTKFIDTVSQASNGKISATKKTLPSASTSVAGIVQLSSATNSTSTSLAATPSAVKSAYDLANNAIPKSVGTAAGDIIYFSDANTPAKLSKGENGQVLKIVNGNLAWETMGANDVGVDLDNWSGSANIVTIGTLQSGQISWNLLTNIPNASINENKAGIVKLSNKINDIYDEETAATSKAVATVYNEISSQLSGLTKKQLSEALLYLMTTENHLIEGTEINYNDIPYHLSVDVIDGKNVLVLI